MRGLPEPPASSNIWPSSARGSTAIMASACRPARRQLPGPDTAMPIGGAVSGRSQTFADSTSKCLPRYVTVPPAQRARMISTASSSISWRTPAMGQSSADDVLVQVLAGAEPEGEPPVGKQLHGRRLLRDDGGVIAADRAGDVRHQRNVVGRLGGRAEHAPRVRGVALRVQPREVVVADDREVEAGLLGEGDVSHQLLRTRLLAHHRVADQGHGVPPCCSSARVTTVRSWSPSPLIDDLLPFVGQAAKGREPVVVGRLQGEAHVLERERQRELGRELAVGDPLQLGCLPRGHERAAVEGVHHLSRSRDPADERAPPTAATASDSNASHVLFTTFRREPAPTAPTQIVRSTERVEEGSDARAGLVGP